MSKCLVIFIALFTVTTGYAQTVDKDIRVLLKPGKHLAGVISVSPPTRTARQNELLAKVMKATQQNMKWFTDTMPHLTDLSKYYHKFGLTKEEWDEISTMSDGPTAMNSTITAQDTLELIHKDDLVVFRGHRRLAALDSLHIDLKRNRAVFRGQEIPYVKFQQMVDNNNPFKSSWSGHVYSFEVDGAVDLQHPTDMKNFNSSRYSVMIGKLGNNGKTALLLMALQMEKGKMVKNIVLPCILD